MLDRCSRARAVPINRGSRRARRRPGRLRRCGSRDYRQDRSVLSASLSRFASWAEEMATHSATVAKAAQDHGGRFEQTQQNTPRTQQFADTRQSLTRAQMLMMQTGGLMGGEQVARYGSHLQQLDAQATAQGVSYHLAELPQAPPPPPPVADITNDGANPRAALTSPAWMLPVLARSSTALVPPEPTPAQGWMRQQVAPVRQTPWLIRSSPRKPIRCWLAAQAAHRWVVIPCSRSCRCDDDPGDGRGRLGWRGGSGGQRSQAGRRASHECCPGTHAGVSGGSSESDLGEGLAPDDPGPSDFGGGLGSGGGGGGGMEPAGLDTSLPAGGAGALGAASAPSGPPALPTTSGAAPSASASTQASAGDGCGDGNDAADDGRYGRRCRRRAGSQDVRAR